jgi:hypothetical protein
VKKPPITPEERWEAVLYFYENWRDYYYEKEKYYLEKKDGTRTLCRLWPKDITTREGYGFIRIKGRNYFTHRLSIEKKLNRLLQKGEETRHLCTTTSCFWDEHLESGTPTQNSVFDKRRDGTYPKGENNGFAKITDDIARKILHLYWIQEKKRIEIARIFGISKATVLGVYNGRYWQHIWLEFMENNPDARDRYFARKDARR